ncbi:male-specific lethal 3 homolog isoform X3 [Pomacea canaliculata]|nr:male-specific lethal 3 homolog isoform X3 [Pomacea canaliculata]XP_025087128.1 male-specific lethal 3 homolog isoform X3 [Pomacea canaliculata]XP_025087129.1 male-specific lethal 3 homolog isoform X3 [Pomacea canaliculata]
MKRLSETAKKYHKNSRRRRKIEQILKASGIRTPSSFDSDSWSEGSSSQDDQSETEGEDEPEQNSPENGKKSRTRRKMPQKQQMGAPVSMEIPEILKAHLEEDYIAVSVKSKLCLLPAKPCVLDILEGFMKTFCINYLCESFEQKDRDKSRVEKNIKIPPEHLVSLCKEVVEGLRILFDFTLPIILLYATEQEQYEDIMKHTIAADLHFQDSLHSDKGMHESGSKHYHRQGKSELEDEEIDVTHSTRQRHLSGHRQVKIEQEDDCDAVHNSDDVPRRVTRRYTLDAQRSPEEPSGTKNLKRQKKQLSQDGGQSPKMSPRIRRRRNHEGILTVKVEDQSDSEAEFSPPASASSGVGHSNDASALTASLSQLCEAGKPLTESPSQTGTVHKKEDLADSILAWQILPPEIRKKSPVTPSQVYGIQHLLRLFVKLPELLNHMPFDPNKLQVLVKLCHHCLQYLIEHQGEFYR